MDFSDITLIAHALGFEIGFSDMDESEHGAAVALASQEILLWVREISRERPGASFKKHTLE